MESNYRQISAEEARRYILKRNCKIRNLILLYIIHISCSSFFLSHLLSFIPSHLNQPFLCCFQSSVIPSFFSSFLPIFLHFSIHSPLFQRTSHFSFLIHFLHFLLFFHSSFFLSTYLYAF